MPYAHGTEMAEALWIVCVIRFSGWGVSNGQRAVLLSKYVVSLRAGVS